MNVYKNSGMVVPLSTTAEGHPICPHCGDTLVQVGTDEPDTIIWQCPLVARMESDLRKALTHTIDHILDE